MDYSKNDIRAKAADLRANALRNGTKLSHGQSLNEASKLCGFSSWNAACGTLPDDASDEKNNTRTPTSDAEIGRSTAYTSSALPPLLLGFYSAADAGRHDYESAHWPVEYIASHETEAGPQADETSKIRFLRATQYGVILGGSTFSVWHYGHTGGSPDEMWRIHSDLYEYHGKIILRVIWQPVLAGGMDGLVYIAAWKSTDAWRHGMDVWCGRHSTCEALEALLADMKSRQMESR